jgi:hypothetical protein
VPALKSVNVSLHEGTSQEAGTMAEEKRVTEKTETETETKNRWATPGNPNEGEYKKTTKVERTEESDDKPTIVVHEED